VVPSVVTVASVDAFEVTKQLKFN